MIQGAVTLAPPNSETSSIPKGGHYTGGNTQEADTSLYCVFILFADEELPDYLINSCKTGGKFAVPKCQIVLSISIFGQTTCNTQDL